MIALGQRFRYRRMLKSSISRLEKKIYLNGSRGYARLRNNYNRATSHDHFYHMYVWTRYVSETRLNAKTHIVWLTFPDSRNCVPNHFRNRPPRNVKEKKRKERECRQGRMEIGKYAERYGSVIVLDFRNRVSRNVNKRERKRKKIWK